VEPNDYWLAAEERRSQHLYIAFCEFASAALDYCEGGRLLEGPESARLNWAATALYYSLVHSSRFAVFMAVGDFPTSHAALARSFDPHTTQVPRTNWLRGFLANEAATEDCCTCASFEKLCAFWSQHVNADKVDRTLRWFNRVLARSRQLRNENNYEALLIAHEYRHPEVTHHFSRLARAMHSTAQTGLKVITRWFHEYLVTRPEPGDDRWYIEASDFIRVYSKARILEAARTWYPKRVVDQLEEIMQPLTSAIGTTMGRRWRRFEDDVDWAIFNPKRGLMTDFRTRIEEFYRLLEVEDPTVEAVPVAPSSAIRTTTESAKGPESATPRERVEQENRLRSERRASTRRERAALIAKLSQLPPCERLLAIARDSVHPVQYYPPEFAAVEDDVLAEIDPDAAQSLVKRLANERKGVWHNLCGRLRALEQRNR
jgi:hypothetical protein